ncbi:hypothetical protein Hamer_G018501 [Homarus americanus]|uniref:Uncharacterized protein n=1 Tax=Homarus americanus TaxID=6706 RepID=A0A8J5JE08_HOMAM|nr:hypothetical protein Hamer_G018501 [Homarus americanus]
MTTSMKKTRSYVDVWILGKPSSELSHQVRLPTNGNILRYVVFHHMEQNELLNRSFRLAADGVLEMWTKARIPTQSVDSVIRKIKKLHEQYVNLKKTGFLHKKMTESRSLCSKTH